jgi:hypothetical protein
LTFWRRENELLTFNISPIKVNIVRERTFFTVFEAYSALKKIYYLIILALIAGTGTRKR